MMALLQDNAPLSTATARGYMVSMVTLASSELARAAAHVAAGDAKGAHWAMQRSAAYYRAALDTLPEAVSEIERDGGGAP